MTLDVNLAAARVSVIPVDVVNSELLDPDGGLEHGWRYVIVAEEILKQYRVA